MSYFEKTQILAADSPSIDAFGRWRVSEAFTLYEGKFTYDSGSDQWHTKTIGNATASYLPNNSAIDMRVSNISGSAVIRQTTRYMPYQPGKSQLIFCTGNFDGKIDGIIKRIGYFDDENGIFFEQSGSNIGITRRSSISGIAVDTFVSQSEWNLDKMDGSGPSGHIIDFSKSQIYYEDFEWLGVGRIRYGVYFHGKAYYVHEFTHANELTTVYMGNSNLPVRYEIRNMTGTILTGSMIQLCSTVISEAGYNVFNGRERSVNSGENTIRIDANTYGMTLAVRQQINRKSATIIPTYLSVVTPSGPDKQWAILLNPTLVSSITGSSNWNIVAGSNLEYITGSSANGSMNIITNEGIKLASGWFSTTNDMISVNLSQFVSLGIDLNNTRDILVLATRSSGVGSDGHASMAFKEII